MVCDDHEMVNDSQTHRSLPQPPPTVVLSTALLGVSCAATFTFWFSRALGVSVAGGFLYAIIGLLMFLVLRGIYRGRRWAY